MLKLPPNTCYIFALLGSKGILHSFYSMKDLLTRCFCPISKSPKRCSLGDITGKTSHLNDHMIFSVGFTARGLEDTAYLSLRV